MDFLPELHFNIFNTFIFFILFFIFTMTLSYILDKDGFKRGADQSWLKKEDRLRMYISSYVFFSIIIFSLWVPLKPGNNIFYIGIFIYLIAIILAAFTSISFVTADKDKLITKGVYKYSRNPIYLIYSLIILSTVFLNGTWLYLIFFFIYLFSTYFTISVEESYLIKKYPDEYKNYLAKTPRYFLFF